MMTYEGGVCLQEFTATLLHPCVSEPEFQVRPVPPVLVGCFAASVHAKDCA